MTKENLIVSIVAFIGGIVFGLAITSSAPSKEIIYQEYLPVRNEYVMVHPKGTDDIIEIFLEKPYQWKVCTNGLSHCQEVIIK